MTENHLILFSDTSRGGAADVERRYRRGEIVRVRHGAYFPADQWRAARPEQKMRMRAHALERTAERRPITAGRTAGALHRLALFRVTDDRVHVLEPGRRPASSLADVVRHRGPLDPGDLVEIDGLQVTSLARTVYDLIRLESAETAVAAFDAALRQVAWRNWGHYDQRAEDELRDDIRERVERAPGARGIRQARFLVEFADGRAQLPGESVSRLWMDRLGVAAPELQVAVDIDGGRAFPDFSWPALRRFGEFDGDAKYLDIQLTGGRDPREVLRSQRSREMAVIAATGWTPLRWGWERLESLADFERFLRAQRMLAGR